MRSKGMAMKKKVSRRWFLKTGGAAGAAMGSAGLGFFGYESGRDPRTHTGCVDYQGQGRLFDRNKFTVDRPHYRRVGEPSRVDARTEVVFSRFYQLMNQWTEKKKTAGLDPLLREYYQNHPRELEMDLRLIRDISTRRMIDQKKFGNKFVLSSAWSKALGAVKPFPIQHPPEISDFPGGDRFGEPSTPLKMKHPALTSKLIKKIAQEFGATLVGIAELDHNWVYSHPLQGRGFKPDQPLKVPQHWIYAIVVATPMSWDPMYASPNYGISTDAYSRSSIVAFRLASFIRQLGYASRPHIPIMEYDLMVTPIAIDAGLGEQGRHSLLITPELGANVKPAVITTNLPLKPDKPIEFGVQDFCRHCNICADNCPSGAISPGDKVSVRGYVRYQIDIQKCHNFWYSNLGNLGCRVCMAVCPYTKKSNWLHRSMLQITANDPTGLSDRVLIELHKLFYKGPPPDHYFMPGLGGENASYQNPPWWLRTDDFVDIQS